MIKRHREIISKILNTDGYISVHKLADFCNVSTRTIQLDVKEVNKELSKYNIKIDSIIKKGYYFTEETKKLLIENNIIRSIFDYQYITETPMLPLERQMYILLNLTIEESFDLDKLEDNLYISTSTLRKDIDYSKKWLKENLNITYSFAKNAYFNHTEKEKRNIISWVMGRKVNQRSYFKYWKYIFNEINITPYFYKMYNVIDKETKKYGYCLSGDSCQLFSIEVLIALRRFQLGYLLEESNIIQDLLPMIISLREKVKCNFNIELPVIEWINLQQYFKSKQLIKGTNIKLIEMKESISVIDELYKNINNKFNIDLSNHSKLKEQFLLYFTPMINRLKFRHCIANPINEDIIENYPFEFQMANELATIVKKKLNLDMQLIELAYITLHLASVNELWNKKLKTIIVCNYDECIISIIKNKVFKYLSTSGDYEF